MKGELEKSIAKVIKDLFGQEVTVALTRPDEQFGDYATNVALQLAGKLNKNPYEIAKQLAESKELMDATSGGVSKVSVEGPGFLNIKLNDKSLVKSLKEKPAKFLQGQKVVTEYSDPNPFKPLHAGHLYTTLVGDSIARILEAGGAEVIRVNYGGDVGLHVGKSMWAIILHLHGENPGKLKEISETDRANWLGDRYIEGNDAYENDESKKAEIVEMNKRVYKIHETDDHDSPFAQIYWTCRDWSYDYFKKLYKQLQVHAFNRVIPESEVASLGVKIVREQLSSGVYSDSQGAIVFDGEKFGLHTRVFITSEGLPTYEAKEVGLLLTKWNEYLFDKSIIITANEQQQYMEVVVKSVEQFDPEPAKRSRHLTHGMVRLAGNEKMSSRKGNIVGALDIIDAAEAANKKLRDSSNEQIILGAVKYAFLKNRIGGDIVYDPQESVTLEGNSGPYLQYAHARAQSILAKVETTRNELEGELEKDERSLVRKLSEYPEVVNNAINELMPHHVCTYLYELAQKFNSFYEKNRVIGDERQTLRLVLVERYASTLKEGLRLLGIEAPDHI